MAAVKEGQLPNVPTVAVSAIGSQVAEQAHQFLEANIKAWMKPNLPQVNHEADMPVPGVSGITQRALLEHNHSYQSQRRETSCSSNPYSMITPTRLPVPSYRPQHCPHSQAQSHQASAAASFFARAAQKLNLSSRKKRHYHSSAELEPDLPGFPTKYSDCLKIALPPAPPALLRNVGRKDVSGLGKVKVMLRLSPVSTCSESSSSFLTVDSRKKQVTVFDPSSCGYITPEERRAGVAAPKMFAFDAIFSQDDSQTEVCSSSLTEVIQAVVNGSDGCLFSYGPSKLGKTYTMLGSTESVQSLGIIPCAITWLYKLINEEKQKTGARFSVRVSAVEVAGRDEVLKDLLLEHASGTENSGTSPGIFLREDPIFGAQLQNQSELRVPNVEKAAYYLDAALAAASGTNEEEERNSHLLFTLHVYQYRVDKSGKGAVAGGRSRLHLLDLGSNERQGKGLSLSAIANVILAIFNGQKHVPYREFKLTQLLREVLGSISCRAAMIAHVTGSLPNYAETLATIQFAARIHRLRRKKLKYCGASSGDSSSEELKFRRHLREGGVRSGSSDPDCTSSSEQSGDTVIYVGHNGLPISDKELTDNEGPPRALPVFNQMNLGASTDQRLVATTSSSCDVVSTSNIVLTGTHVKKPLAVSVDANKSGNNLMSSGRTAIRCSAPAKSNHQHRGHGKSSLIPVKMKSNSPMCNNGYIEIGPNSSVPSHYLSTSGNCQQRSSPPGANQNLRASGIGSSEEQWVDGPRISKAWLESRSGLPRREMWIDGPQAIYGWMDQHKRDMIQRWVELQSAQVQGFSSESEEVWVDDSLKYRLRSPAVCNSTNQELPDEIASEHCAEPVIASPFRATEKSVFSSETLTEMISEVNPTKSDGINVKKLINGNISKTEIPFRVIHPIDSNHAVLQFVNSKSPSPNISGHSPIQQDVKLSDGIIELHKAEEGIEDNSCENNEISECMAEYIPTVPTQDSCLQVNEEDIIAACYGIYEEHPLRILSEENLASSFADSFSMSAELENFSVQESADGDNCDHMDEMALKLETMSHFSVPACFSHLSISQTVSKEICRDDASIRSEPIHLEPHQILTALRTNICWSGLGRWKETVTLSTCLQPESLVSPNETTEPKFSLTQQYCTNVKEDEQLTKTNYENRLRHPDGASNPDLSKAFEEPVCINTALLPSFCEQRSPGNGASYSDNEDKLCNDWITDTGRTITNEQANEKDQNQGLKDEGKLDIIKTHNHRHSKLIRFFSSSKESTKAHGNHVKTSPKLSSRIPIANCKTRKTSVKLPSKNLYSQSCSVIPPPTDVTKSKKSRKLQLVSVPPDSSNFTGLAIDKTCHTNVDQDKNKKTLASGDSAPSHSIDKPRRSSIAGLNSTDNNSSLSSDATPPSLKLIRKNGPPHQISGTSSGYESMIRDSEGSGSSFSNVDVGTDSSDDEQTRISNDTHSCNNSKPCLDTFEVAEYNKEDIERLERRRLIEETLELRRHHRRVLHLRIKQDELRKDLAAAKSRLMANPQRWSYDLHVQDNMDVDDPGFLEVLERETQILEKRVMACKSRVVMVTAFDSKPKVLPLTEPQTSVELPL